tara:strand:+ start:143 stop:673 length:531 start_codon:yes stop_codon:yes gene_type:complete
MGKTKEIELNSYDMLTAAQTGLLRAIESDKRKESWGAGYNKNLNKKIADSISGAMGEIAVANCLKIVYQFHCNVGSIPDLMYNDLKIQVRCQPPKKFNSLIIRPGYDKENQLFVHVIDEAPIFKISGFTNSSKFLGTAQYLTTFGLDRPACHAIPLNLLSDIDEIKTYDQNKNTNL